MGIPTVGLFLDISFCNLFNFYYKGNITSKIIFNEKHIK
jgi:hypothetical protein